MTRFTAHALGLICTLGATAAWAEPPPSESPASSPSTPPAAEASPAAPSTAAGVPAPPLPETKPEAVPASPPSPPPSNRSSGMGLSPTALQLGSEASSLAGVDAALSGASLGTKMQLHGYLRAPMRIGYGPRNDGGARPHVHA